MLTIESTGTLGETQAEHDLRAKADEDRSKTSDWWRSADGKTLCSWPKDRVYWWNAFWCWHGAQPQWFRTLSVFGGGALLLGGAGYGGYRVYRKVKGK